MSFSNTNAQKQKKYKHKYRCNGVPHLNLLSVEGDACLYYGISFSNTQTWEWFPNKHKYKLRTNCDGDECLYHLVWFSNTQTRVWFPNKQKSIYKYKWLASCNGDAYFIMIILITLYITLMRDPHCIEGNIWNYQNDCQIYAKRSFNLSSDNVRSFL